MKNALMESRNAVETAGRGKCLVACRVSVTKAVIPVRGGNRLFGNFTAGNGDTGCPRQFCGPMRPAGDFK